MGASRLALVDDKNKILLQDADPAGLGTAQQAIALAPNDMLIASTTYTRLGLLLHQDVLTQ